MNSPWKKSLIRHSLFVYSRDTLIFFVNLFAWAQSQDLRLIAVFNIIYLSAHTCMFLLALPALKRGKGQLLMKTSLAGMAATLAAILLLGDDTINYLYAVGFFAGVFNGLYWLVAHVESLDISNNTNRTSFFAYRVATQGAARLAVPGIGWLLFTIFGNNTSGYSAVFTVAFVSLIGSFVLTEIAQRVETKLDFWKSFRELHRTKNFGLLQLNGFMYGVSIRSALAVILLPFLIFQVVETESSLNMLQTFFEILAVIAAAFFARHRKNTSYISKLFVFGALVTFIGLTSLYIELNIISYVIFAITYIFAFTTLNISSQTMSLNFVSSIKNAAAHRMEFIVIREPAALSGFISGYVFVYFNPDLGLDSLRPLLLFTIFATIVFAATSLYLWRYVQAQSTS